MSLKRVNAIDLSEVVPGFKARVKILASYETRKPNESIGTNHVILA